MFDYTYGTGTEFGQIKTLARTLPSSGGTTWTATTQTFTHDVIGQLKQSAETGLSTRSYTYDLAGNRATKSEGGVSTSYGPANTVNQITSATGGTDAYSNATSDANGNLIQIVYSDGSRRVMTWDSINRLKRIEILAGVNPANGDKATDFTYNGLSQRTQNTNWTHNGTYWASVTYDWFVWADGEIVQKRAGSTTYTTGTNYYEEGESRHVVVNTIPTSYKHYYTRDHLGTVYEMTDWAGAAQAAYTYGPYGDRSKRYGSHEAEISYTGHWVYKPSAATHAAAKQLYLTWYRVYDPQAGRWLSRDPIGEAGGVNLYGYVGNNPIAHWDPYGLDIYYDNSGIRHADVIISDPTSKTGYCKYSYSGAESGWDTSAEKKAALNDQGVMKKGPHKENLIPKHAVRLKLTPEQDARARAMGDKLMGKPGRYSVLGRNCASAAKKMVEAAIEMPIKTPWPERPDHLRKTFEFMNKWPEQYNLRQ